MDRIGQLAEQYGEELEMRVAMGVNTQRLIYDYSKNKGMGIKIREVDKLMKRLGYNKYDSPDCITCGEKEYRKD